MVTSNYQADVIVEIAFNAGVGTASASYTWTDVSAYVELDRSITTTGGRSDERSTADANQLTLTLDNRDGRFTAGLSTSPYYPNVKLNRPIRVRATPVDGANTTLFTGFINEWPVDWSDGTDATAYATITASSRLSRLGLQSSLISLVETAIRADSPATYYMMGEPTGSTQANDSSGNHASPLVAYPFAALAPAVVFGSATGPSTDSLTAATFAAAGEQLFNVTAAATYAGASMEAFFLISTPPGVSGSFFATDFDATTGLGLGVTAAGLPIVRGGSTVTGATGVCDGVTHHMAVTWDGATVTLYVDGVVAGSTGAVGTPRLGPIALGGIQSDVTIAHLATYAVTLTAGQVAAHATAGLTGYVGDTTSARLIRYAALAGIAAADVSAETGQTTMQHIDTTDKQVVDLMRVCETTEGGFLFDGRGGSLRLHNRAHRYAAASLYTLNMAEDEVEAGYLPKYDRTGLLNDITAKDISGSYTAHVSDAASIADHGQSSASIETASQDDEAPLNQASWTLYANKDPKERAPTLEVDCLAQVGKTPNCSAVLATTLGDKITVSNRPAQASSSSVDYFVEGYTITIGPESLRMSFNLSPSAPYDRVLIIDDPVRGRIDTYAIGF